MIKYEKRKEKERQREQKSRVKDGSKERKWL